MQRHWNRWGSPCRHWSVVEVLSKVLMSPDCNPIIKYDYSYVDAHLWLHDFGSHDVPRVQH